MGCPSGKICRPDQSETTGRTLANIDFCMKFIIEVEINRTKLSQFEGSFDVPFLSHRVANDDSGGNVIPLDLLEDRFKNSRVASAEVYPGRNDDQRRHLVCPNEP